jgi:hypothetical protein
MWYQGQGAFSLISANKWSTEPINVFGFGWPPKFLIWPHQRAPIPAFRAKSSRPWHFYRLSLNTQAVEPQKCDSIRYPGVAMGAGVGPTWLALMGRVCIKNCSE